MTERRPIVLQDGEMQEISDADTIIPQSASFSGMMIPDSGSFVATHAVIGPFSSASLAGNAINTHPIVFPYPFTADAMGVNVTTGVADSNAAVVCFAADLDTGRPDTLNFQTVDIPTDTPGFKTGAITGNFTFHRGVRYWIGIRSSHAIGVTLTGTASAPSLGIRDGEPLVQRLHLVRGGIAFGTPITGWGGYSTGHFSSQAPRYILARIA